MLTADPFTVDRPGMYELHETAYHADVVPGGSLSVSGAKLLLPPGCPALFDYRRRHPEHKREYDLGHAAHHFVLGTGPELVVIDAANYLTKKAKEARDAAYAIGAVPLLEHEFDQAQAMATALRRHPAAVEVLGGDGAAEQSLFWRDPDTGVWCRARPDWMTTERIVDYKTTTDAHPDAFARSAASFGYHQQADWYLSGAVHLDLVDPDAPFYFVAQSKTPPYLVSVVEFRDEDLAVGRALNERARHVYAECSAAGEWPGYSDDIELISLPPYMRRRVLEDL
jgi:hypothetical protein